MPSIFSPIPALDVELLSTLSSSNLIFSGCRRRQDSFVRRRADSKVWHTAISHSKCSLRRIGIE